MYEVKHFVKHNNCVTNRGKILVICYESYVLLRYVMCTVNQQLLYVGVVYIFFSFFSCEDDLARAKSEYSVHLFALFGTHRHASVFRLPHSTDSS